MAMKDWPFSSSHSFHDHIPTITNNSCQNKFAPVIANDHIANLLLLVYVDHVIITGNSLQTINNFISSLNAYFPLNDLGDPHYFLRIQVKTNYLPWQLKCCAICFKSNSSFSYRTFWTWLYFVREKTQAKEILVQHIPSSGQTTNILTKPTSTSIFPKCRFKLSSLIHPWVCKGV